ncbi:hypothetical protein MSNKSG1_15746 [Marinobacter santoriniensis NKSG1]|uniref:Uncharacterized protein n=1 Tax=Marinobacter santoriniensis NKSG1 TaxID=1288826 RepID=M7CQS2_9GAMM|nr:hypothetical protein [Marinobacter santoriniensis]EMP54425.1 hypothetical protein MSNKSG1_15746 [Marinobacter santoriniensis NKSG1]
MSESITQNDVDIIQAIIKSFYGQGNARLFTSSTITDDTILKVVELLAETEDCSTWIDSVPNPQDLLMPANKLRKWALRIIRKSGEPFLVGNMRINIMCKRFRAAQFKPAIIDSLN